MIIILFGAPGVGKGTLAQRLQEAGIGRQVSTGDLFRREIAIGSEIGIEAKTAVEAGKWASDELALKLVLRELHGNVILDGYPRTVKQVEDLDKLLSEKNQKVDLVINVIADEDVVVDRIVNRNVCSNCHAIYNVKYAPTKIEGKCDKCGGKVEHRSDDNEEVIRSRFEQHNTKTRPLLERYKTLSKVIDIDSSHVNAVEKIKSALTAAQ